MTFESKEDSQAWDTASKCSSSFNPSMIKEAIRKVQHSCLPQRDVPTLYVTMTKTFQQIRDLTESLASQYVNNSMPSHFTGIPIEHYPTLRECMDRMVVAKDGERLQLIASSNDLTVELLDHPYMRGMRDQLRDSYRIDFSQLTYAECSYEP